MGDAVQVQEWLSQPTWASCPQASPLAHRLARGQMQSWGEGVLIVVLSCLVGTRPSEALSSLGFLPSEWWSLPLQTFWALTLCPCMDDLGPLCASVSLSRKGQQLQVLSGNLNQQIIQVQTLYECSLHHSAAE